MAEWMPLFTDIGIPPKDLPHLSLPQMVDHVEYLISKAEASGGRQA